MQTFSVNNFICVLHEEAAIESMLRWCQEGPPEAIVEQVKASYEPPEGLPSFNIRR